jgi:imidazolonepropionase-like amidohydrolase
MRLLVAALVLAGCGTATPDSGEPAAPQGEHRAPAIIDSHVHLSYLSVADEHRRGGVVAAVDLAAPQASLEDPSALAHIRSGPMLTGVAGYPTQSWGAGGYGRECDSPNSARNAVRVAHALGARVVKLALDADGLPPLLAVAAVEEAREHGMKVVAHAMSAEAVALAADMGVDALAHTPLEPIGDEVAAKFRGRAVISTLTAFGGTPEMLANLSRLKKAGAIVLYGTDLGNWPNPGVSADEIRLMVRAGLSPEEVVEAMTWAPARFWGLEELLSSPAKESGNYLVLEADPLEDPTVLSRPVEVYMNGEKLTSTPSPTR